MIFNTIKMKSIESLYKEYPFRSAAKFIPLAIENGFTRKEANKFLKTIPRDIKYTNQSNLMLPIYGKHSGSFQMDTLIQTKQANPRYFLIIININSRKLYAYPMKTKNSDDVFKALVDFLDEVKDVQSITSDQDRAYLTQDITNYFLRNNIDHQTTLENDHNRLGIINRAIKTLRDLNQDRDFTIDSMKKCLHAYNNSIHSSTHMKPNQFDSSDEIEYIDKMDKVTEAKKSNELKPNTHVRIINDKVTIGKKRSNLSTNSYIVDSKLRNKYIIRAKDNTVSEYPRYRLVVDNKAKIANTFQNKRAIIDHIDSYSKNHYKVKFTDGDKGTLTIKQMREGHPTKLSSHELEYWSKNKSSLPNEFRYML